MCRCLMLKATITRDTKDVITKSRKVELYYPKKFTLLRISALVKKPRVVTIKAEK